jgi:hypothetical protein
VIFKSAAQFLHLYGGTEAIGSPWKAGEAALATPAMKTVSASIAGDQNAALPSTGALSDNPNDARVSSSPKKIGEAGPANPEIKTLSASVAGDQDAALTSTGASSESLVSADSDPAFQHIEQEANFSDVSGLPTKTIQATPLLNAQIILDFTNGTEHTLQFDRQNILNSLPVRLETGDTRKLLIFDAPWLQVKSFMLMPGVMMVEDDLLGGVNRAGMEMKGTPVSLDLGGGLNLTLLGVIDFGFT